ncbi:MAG: acetolactate synthase large subunit [Planctomycetes bacterium]|nr:acetolactate synthase large subunit [Planctomycetota bacterium]
MKASDLFLRCLETEGIEFIFGVPGEENADIMISLLDSKMRFIVCRHEQAAAFMADVYGRLTGRVSCCLGTLGPGATNLITGVGDANMDRAPCLVLTGQAATTRLHKESHQAMDLVALFRPTVKWGTSVMHADAIPEIIRKAVRVATTDKYGATHIDLPEDIAKMPTLAQPIPPREVARSAPNPDALKEAVAVIRKAKFPVILTGNGTLRNNASDQLRAFARATGIPVLNTFMGKGAFPPSDPLCLFTIGLGSRDWPAVCVEEADCVISVGFDMVEYHPKAWNKGNSKTIVHVDQSPSEIDENYRTAAEVVGDICMSLEALTKSLRKMKKPSPELYSKYRETMLEEFHRHDDDRAVPMKPQKVMHEIRKALPDDAIVLSDVGAHKMWMSRYFHTEVPNTVMISNGWCSMGFALPGAIGAKFAYPDRKVLAVCGDGGFLMNVQDMETAVREKTPIIVVVWVDSQYGLIRWKQTAGYGKWSHIDFGNPDFMKLADAFGWDGHLIGKTSDLPKALKAALKSDKPTLIAVPIDYSENMKLTAALKQIPPAAICDALGKVPLFKGLPKPYRDWMTEHMDERRFAAGAVAFNQGEPGTDVFVIHDGTFTVEKDGKTVATLGAGQAFGEMAALSDAPRSATVKAAADSVVSVLSGAEFRNMVRAQPELGLALNKILAERLAQA